MNYFIIALLTTTVTAIVLYFLLNKVLHIKIRITPLVLCVACSLFVSMTLPKVILRYTDWLGALAVLSIFSVIIAYFLAYYEGTLEVQHSEAEPQICFSESVISKDLSVPVFIPEPNIAQSTPAREVPPEAANYLPEAETSPPGYDAVQTIAKPELNVLDSFSIPAAFDEQLELAFHLKEKQRFSAAATLFQNVLKENPGSEATPLILLQIADSLKNAEEYQQAIDILTTSSDFSATYDMEIERQFNELLTELQYLQNAKNMGGF